MARFDGLEERNDCLLATGYDFSAGIHLFRYHELNILLDVNSGALHVLDELGCRLTEELRTWDGDIERALSSLGGEFDEQELRQAAAEFRAAHQEGALFTREDELGLDLSGLPIKALCLNVAHACNMKCRYCFASQGDFGLKPSLMSLATAQKALDFLIGASGHAKTLEVDFFGGEPLLNAEMIRELVIYGRQREAQTGKRFNFTLTTNGLLLDQDMMDFIIAHEVSVIMSLDGRPEINDRHRILTSGQGSYEQIVPKIRQMVEKRPASYYIRGTFTRLNPDFSRDLEHIIELGFDAVSLEPAVGPANCYGIQESDLPGVLAEYDRVTDLLWDYQRSRQPVHFFHYNLDLQKGPCLAKRQTGCGAGVEYLVVTPEGDIYPCHQFVGEKDFRMGNIADGVVDLEIKERFLRNRLKDKAECLACWARNFCGGGCYANAFHANGDLNRPDRVSCEMHRKRIEGAIYLEVQKRLSGNIWEDGKQEF